MEFTPKIKFSNPGKFSWFNLMKHLFRQSKGGEGERVGEGRKERGKVKIRWRGREGRGREKGERKGEGRKERGKVEKRCRGREGRGREKGERKGGEIEREGERRGWVEKRWRGSKGKGREKGEWKGGDKEQRERGGGEG